MATKAKRPPKGLAREFPRLAYGRRKKWADKDGAARLVDDRGWFIGPQDGIDIAEVHHSASQDGATQERWARLFALSPDLYEHALWVVRLYGTDNPQGLAELKEHVAELRAVLGKVIGQ